MESVLLHVCCGPCSIMPVRALKEEGFSVSGWFMNPNVQPLAEYLRRREGAGECASRLGIGILYDDDWDIVKWLGLQLPLAASRERCQQCCRQRLLASARKAAELGIRYFSTTLLYSRYQPHDFIRECGEELARQSGLSFVYRDFRKYWQQGIDISREWGIYRQQYCGCVLSEAERYHKKLAAIKKTSS